LTIKYGGKRAAVEISVEGIRKELIPQDYEELDDEIDEMLNEEYEDESDLDERESFHADTEDWAEEVEESRIWEESMYDLKKELENVLTSIRFSKWEDIHWVCRGPNFPQCHSKDLNPKYYQQNRDQCYNTDHHHHWYCTKCKFVFNPNGWYKGKPEERTPCDCINTDKKGPEFVINILYNDFGVYLSMRYSSVMNKLLQSPEGKVEDNETSIEAA